MTEKLSAIKSPITIGLVLFDVVEELDFVGPWEVFTMVNELRPGLIKPLLISQTGGKVTCAKGLRVECDRSFANAEKLDVMLVPGGQGTRAEIRNPAMMTYIANAARDCAYITSVCTGSLILTAAGPAKGRRVTTHWAFVETLRARGEAAEVLDNVRYIADGNVVTSAGVSAGIDMALWLVGQWFDPGFARQVQRAMEYDPCPPYADVPIAPLN